MSTTIHQTMSSLYLPDSNNIKYSCSIVFSHAEDAELRRVLTMQMEGGGRNAVRMEHTSEAKYVSAQSVLARLCPA